MILYLRSFVDLWFKTDSELRQILCEEFCRLWLIFFLRVETPETQIPGCRLPASVLSVCVCCLCVRAAPLLISMKEPIPPRSVT